ncbi:MAG: hypothetical protein F4X57_12700 [Chloroflexi bacterium]|nr:hypothetical protein [Chloroflexota bacterium]
MTTRIDTGTDRQTLTQFISAFGIEYRWLYADEGGRPPVDPDTDWAEFTASDRFMAWEMYRCVAHHIVAIRGSVWLNDDEDIIMPLGIVEITAASAALGDFWRDFEHRTNDLRLHENRYAPAGRIVRAIYRETIQAFLWHWEGTDAELREPSWPTQWTHEFPLALAELLGTLDKEAALLASIAGTSRIDCSDRHEFAELPIHEHIARHGLRLHSTVHQRRFMKQLRPQDIYIASHLAWSLDKVEARDEQGSSRTRTADRLAHILGASEAIHTTLKAAIATWPMRSRMAVIMAAFIRDVVVPTLRIYGACVAVHIVLDAARVRPRTDDVRAAFISEVLAPTLRYPTEDIPHYERFVSQLRGLHALAREFAGDIRLFSGEVAEGPAESSVS